MKIQICLVSDVINKIKANVLNQEYKLPVYNVCNQFQRKF